MATIVKPSLAMGVVLCMLLSANARAAGADTAVAANPLGGKVVARGALAEQRGGTDAGSGGDLRVTGSVAGNSASNLTTGNNIITDGALAGASGVPMVIQNSGNNVLIQSATIINVTVK